jgi:replication-associated recombination protein RarA
MASIEKFPTVDMSKLEATLTAEAVKQEFESAMKEFEAMGVELIDAAKKCEALGTDVQNLVRETAEAYRQEGKKIFNQIEACSAFTESVRKTCEDAKLKMIGGNDEVQ